MSLLVFFLPFGTISVALVDVCTMNQHCMNGGTCVSANDVYDHRHCVCQDGFSGPRCSHFCPLECQNGGFCTLTPRGGALGDQEQKPTYHASDYMCKCHGYFMGNTCEIPYSNCGGQTKCFNGGKCSSNVDGTHSCQCPPMFTGDSCENVSLEEEVTNMEVEDTNLTGVKAWDASFSISMLFFVFVLLVGYLACRYGRRAFRFSYSDEEQGVADSILKDEMRRMNFKEPASVRKWSSEKNGYNNRGVELNLI